MPNYIVNRNQQPTGEHEVHELTCKELPLPQNRITLGYFENCQNALISARRHFANVDGCAYCSLNCHKK